MRNPFTRPRGHRVLLLGGAACAAVALPVAALAAPSAQQGRARAAARAGGCVAARPALRGGAFVWSANPADGFAGGVTYEVEVTNTGRRPCALRGVPGLAAVGPGGHMVGTRAPASGRGPLIRLAPLATGHFTLTVRDAGAVCAHPVTARVIVYLPRQKRGQDSWLTAAACRGMPGGGVLRATALRAGTGIPLYSS